MACDFDTTAARNYILDSLERDAICSGCVLNSIHVSLRHSPSAGPSAGVGFLEAWESFASSKRTTETIFPALEKAKKRASQVPGVQMLAARYLKEIIEHLVKILWGKGCYCTLQEIRLRVAAPNGGYQYHKFKSDRGTHGVEFTHSGVRTCIMGVPIRPGEDVTAREMFCLAAMAVGSQKAKPRARFHTVRVLSGSPFSQFRILKATIPSSLVSELGKRTCNFTVGFDIESSPYFDVLDQQQLYGLVVAFFNE